MDNSILLSICIPTYNRAPIIRDSLQRILHQIEDCSGTVEILVSDNCSLDNTYEIINNFIKEGNTIKYNRNAKNLGMDGNFEYCFKNASGKYIWILGDDDYLVLGALKKILNFLKQDEYGLIHLNTVKLQNSYREFNSMKRFLKEININITFISGNIVNSKGVEGIDFKDYNATLLSQVPVYLNAITNFKKNIIIYDDLLETSIDGITNGGYNIFEVFVTNYLSILKKYRRKIGYRWYEVQKYKLYRNFLWMWMVKLIVDQNHGLRFQTDNWFKIILKKYWYELYLYPTIALILIKRIKKNKKE